MQLTIHSNPIAAPRMTQRDRWKKRPVVIRYWNWRDLIYQAWAELPVKKRKRFIKPVIIGFKFYVVGYPAIDLDNLIKGVKDGLVRARIIQGDTIKHVPKYDSPEAILLCDKCIYKKGCKTIKSCKFGHAVITINEL